MDEQTFKSKIFHAEVMRDIENRPDYWAGYCRGQQRAFHGKRFGTEEELRIGYRLRTRATGEAMSVDADTSTD